MSLHALASGTLIAAPQSRQGARGPYATATLRVSTGGGEAILASVIAFGTDAERLVEHTTGDALAVSGRAELRAWTGRDGTERHGLAIVAEQIASARPRKREPRRRADRQPESAAAAPFFSDEIAL